MVKNKIFKYFVDGVLWIRCLIKDGGLNSGERNGLYLEYDKKGNIIKRCYYKNGKLNGDYIKYRKDNIKLLRLKHIYSNGKLIEKVNVKSINDAIINPEPIDPKVLGGTL